MNPTSFIKDMFGAFAPALAESGNVGGHLSHAEMERLASPVEERIQRVNAGADLVGFARQREGYAPMYMASHMQPEALEPEAPVVQHSQPASVEPPMGEDALSYTAYDGRKYDGEDAVADQQPQKRRLSLVSNLTHKLTADEREADVTPAEMNPHLYSNEISEAGPQISQDMIYAAGVLAAEGAERPTPESIAPAPSDAAALSIEASRQRVNDFFAEAA